MITIRVEHDEQVTDPSFKSGLLAAIDSMKHDVEHDLLEDHLMWQVVRGIS